MKKIYIILVYLLLLVNLVDAADFLTPDKAFKPYAKVNENSQVQAGVTIAKDIYLYADKLKIELRDAQGIVIKEIRSPKTVEHMGDAVYTTSPEFLVTFSKDSAMKDMRDINVTISYQGCSEQGLCYEPSTRTFTLTLDTSKVAKKALKPLAVTEVKENIKSTAAAPQVEQKSKTDMIADTIKESSFLIVLATFFVFGLLLSLTPCVFPMIPIISGVIISQGEGLTTKKAFFLSVIYVLAMAIAYTIAGVLAGLFGSNLQVALQTPWVIYSFSGIFVALAMSMFGFYELKLPDALVAKVSANSNRGGVLGVAIMGFLSALIVGPCVAAPLAGALVYIGQTGDALLGGAALFFMSLGMGVPLILVGMSAGKFMPKPGAWMTLVNAIFGIMMLGIAIWMLEKILDSATIMLLYAMLGISSAIYLGAFDKESHIFKRSVAFLLFVYSMALFIGYLGGGSSMSKPLKVFKSTALSTGVVMPQSKELQFQIVKSIDELNALLEKNRGKKIMLDFAAEWCSACKELDEITFSDARIKDKLSDYVLIRADVTDNTDKEKALMKKYGVYGPPALIFFDENAKPMRAKTVIGYINPDDFLAHLNSL
ncbi:protein-disulfide reductase DsbD [Sulfurimonas sp.]